ncbi:MAG: cob(I)yrinic acid a,c-diamide adenosyltransferase [Candidatus Micrarchaeota archaeon]|nr:cob(I)yrinic acid a,c-diamide adenosyltransferase [Candidatus Micrarchaeota archaeon]
MSNFYTGKGDNGSSSIMNGAKLGKSDILMEAIGDLDELNSSIGVSLFYVRDEQMRRELRLIQNELFSLGAILAAADSKEFNKARVEKRQIERLEAQIEEMAQKMPALNKFVLPAGSEESSHLHFSRSVARRAERHVAGAAQKYQMQPEVLAYLNRLSSYLFAAAIYLNHKNGIEENNPIY